MRCAESPYLSPTRPRATKRAFMTALIPHQPCHRKVVLSSDAAESMMDIVLKLDFGAWEWKRVQRKA